MKAIVITDNKLNWVDNEDPDCKDNEVIIQMLEEVFFYLD